MEKKKILMHALHLR